MNSKNILPFALAGVAGMSLQTAMAQERDERPNIILFLVDDMGWQDTSEPFWDSVVPQNRIFHTPNMERLARQGMKFTHAYACPVSSPSRVTLISRAYFKDWKEYRKTAARSIGLTVESLAKYNVERAFIAKLKELMPMIK